MLAPLPQTTQEFLLETSILGELEPAICNRLTKGLNAEQELALLERQNFFLTPVEGERHTFRLNRMLRDFLAARLERRERSFVDELHRRAAEALADEGRSLAAIGHSVAARDTSSVAARLLDHAEGLLEHGWMALLRDWFAQIPSEMLGRYGKLVGIQIWAVLFSDGPQAALCLLESRNQAPPADAAQRDFVDAARPLALAMADRYDEALAAGDAALARLPMATPLAGRLLHMGMANVTSVVGDVADAQRHVDKARRGTGAPFITMYCAGMEGLLDLHAGRMRQAAEHFRAGLAFTRAGTHDYSTFDAWSGAAYVIALYERNDLEAAEQAAQHYLPTAMAATIPGHISSVFTACASMSFLRGDLDRSFEILGQLEEFGHRNAYPRLVGNARLERCRQLVLLGQAAASREELQRADDPELWSRVARMRLPANEIEYFDLSQVRWDIHFGESEGVVSRLSSMIRLCNDQQRNRRSIRLNSLLAIALDKAGRSQEAVQLTRRTLKLALAGGFLRLIADEGEGMRTIIERMRAQRALGSISAGGEEAFEIYLDKLLNAFPLSTGGPVTARSEFVQSDSLTKKEIVILLLVADGLSNCAIADRLRVSESTVRTHLRNIHVKLNAKSRGEAVAIARRRGLLE